MLVTNCFSTSHVLRKPDEEGHHQQVHPGGHDGVSPRPAGDLFHREQGRGRQRSRSRCSSTSAAARRAEKARLNIKKEADRQRRHRQPRAEVCRLPHARTSPAARCTSWRATPRSARASSARDAEFQAHHARARQDSQLPEGGLRHASSRARSSPTSCKVLGCGVEVQTQAGQGSLGLQSGEPALEQGHHLHRCRRGRLPDPHADSHHALPARADAHRARAMCTSPSRPCMRSRARARPTLPIPTGEGGHASTASEAQSATSSARRVSARTSRR